MKFLEEGKSFSAHNEIVALDAFLDEMRLLRVGGRLVNAELFRNCKRSIILAKKNQVSKI